MKINPADALLPYLDDEAIITRDLGIDDNDAVIAAFIPTLDFVAEEHIWRDGDRMFKVYSADGVVLDMHPTNDTKAVKWWLVKMAAHELKLSIIQPFWTGQAAEFRVSSLPDVPKPENTIVSIRSYSRGPWIKLEREERDLEKEPERDAADESSDATAADAA